MSTTFPVTDIRFGHSKMQQQTKFPRTSLEQKVMILDYYHASKQPQQSTVDYFKDRFSVSTSSLSEWIKYESDLRARFEESKMSQTHFGSHLRNAKRKTIFKYNDINKAMGDLVEGRLRNGHPITESILREHWRLFARKFGVDDPKRLEGFSHGWLSQFKKRHGLNRKTMRDHNNACKMMQENGGHDPDHNDSSSFIDSRENNAKRGNIASSLHLNTSQDFSLPQSLSSYASATTLSKQHTLPLGGPGPLQSQSRHLLLQPQQQSLGSVPARLSSQLQSGSHSSPDSLLSPTQGLSNTDNDYSIGLDSDRYPGYDISPPTPLSMQNPINHRMTNSVNSNSLLHHRHGHHNNPNNNNNPSNANSSLQQQQKYPSTLNNYRTSNSSSSLMQTTGLSSQSLNSYGVLNKSNLNPVLGNGSSNPASNASNSNNANGNSGGSSATGNTSNGNSNASGPNHFQSFLLIDNQLQMSMNRLANNMQRDDSGLHDIQSQHQTNDNQPPQSQQQHHSPQSRQTSIHTSQSQTQTQSQSQSQPQSQAQSQTQAQAQPHTQTQSQAQTQTPSQTQSQSGSSQSAQQQGQSQTQTQSGSGNSGGSSGNDPNPAEYLPNININDMERFIFVWAEKFFTSNEFGMSFGKSRDVFQDFKSKFLEEKARYIIQRGSSSVVDDFFLRRKN